MDHCQYTIRAVRHNKSNTVRATKSHIQKAQFIFLRHCDRISGTKISLQIKLQNLRPAKYAIVKKQT